MAETRLQKIFIPGKFHATYSLFQQTLCLRTPCRTCESPCSTLEISPGFFYSKICKTKKKRGGSSPKERDSEKRRRGSEQAWQRCFRHEKQQFPVSQLVHLDSLFFFFSICALVLIFFLLGGCSALEVLVSHTATCFQSRDSRRNLHPKLLSQKHTVKKRGGLYYFSVPTPSLHDKIPPPLIDLILPNKRTQVIFQLSCIISTRVLRSYYVRVRAVVLRTMASGFIYEWKIRVGERGRVDILCIGFELMGEGKWSQMPLNICRQHVGVTDLGQIVFDLITAAHETLAIRSFSLYFHILMVISTNFRLR